MRQSHQVAALSLLSLALLAGCNSDNDTQTPEPVTGRWLKGDLHVHTAVSQDSRETQADILKWGFEDFGLDYMSLTNHMRNNSQDNEDNDLGGILFYDALTRYEKPGLASLMPNYPGKLVYSGFEWDMPTHEHFNIAILADEQQTLDAIKTFEYSFSAKNEPEDFAAEDLAAWEAAGVKRQNQTHADAVAALAWLQQHFPKQSYGMLNHPRRYLDSYTIAEVRELHDAAPEVFFLVEGMVGGQFSGNRGDYGDRSSGVYGGVDPVVAEVGGWWDALLGEGRRIWNMGNSDIHFKTRPPYASSYYPGEYAKNYTWVEGEGTQALLEGLRSGNSFAVFGDLIDGLDFQMNTGKQTITMGQTLSAKAGDKVTINIRFRSPELNNKESDIGNEHYAGINPGVHHIDLIAGDIGERAKPGTAAWQKETNDSTRVIKSFTQADWQKDSDGFYNMSFSFIADGKQYFRLRGTNLDYNVSGLTNKGTPLRSEVLPQAEGEQVQQWYNDINERNYGDLWFYSNPLFITTQS
ncbi:MAG: hypothetical protein Sw2LagBPW_28040 [Shewanella algae]